MARETSARWLAKILPTKNLIRKAEESERKIDKSIGRQMSHEIQTTPETDWRTLCRKR